MLFPPLSRDSGPTRESVHPRQPDAPIAESPTFPVESARGLAPNTGFEPLRLNEGRSMVPHDPHDPHRALPTESSSGQAPAEY